MGSLDAGSVVGFQLRLTTAVLVVALASQAEAQFYAHYRSLPFSLENAIDAEDVNLIVRGHVSRTRNDLYPVKVAGGAVAGQLPATFVTMAVVEVLKDHDLFKPGQSLEIRHSGFTADARASEEVTKDWDPQWPRMEVGREYVLFVFINQSGKLWLYSPQGVFGERDGRVLPQIRSAVGDTWKGKPWETFLQAIRRHSRKRAR